MHPQSHRYDPATGTSARSVDMYRLDAAQLDPPHCSTERRRPSGNKQAALSRRQPYLYKLTNFLHIKEAFTLNPLVELKKKKS